MLRRLERATGSAGYREEVDALGARERSLAAEGRRLAQRRETMQGDLDSRRAAGRAPGEGAGGAPGGGGGGRPGRRGGVGPGRSSWRGFLFAGGGGARRGGWAGGGGRGGGEEEASRWQALAEERERLLGLSQEALDLIGQEIRKGLRIREETYETERATLFLLRRENLFLRGESHITWEAVRRGVGDLAALPAFVVDSVGAVGRYFATPGHGAGALTYFGGALAFALALFLAGRGLRARLRSLEARREDKEVAGAAEALARFLRAFLIALFLFLLPHGATLLLPALPLGVEALLSSLGWILGGFWLLGALNRQLLGHGDRPGLLGRGDPRALARMRVGVRLLLYLSLVVLPFHQALTHLGYGNVGATECLLLGYKIAAGAVLVTLLLRRRHLLALLPSGEGRLGRFLRLSVAVLQPVVVLLVPGLLLLDVFRYDILAGLIAGLSGIVLAVSVAGALVYRVAMLLALSRIRRPEAGEEREGGARRRESAELVTRFVLRTLFFFLSAWAALALAGASLAEVRTLFGEPLPFVGAGSERPVTWWNLFVAVFLLFFALAAVRAIKRALYDLLLQRTGLDRGLQYTITTLVGYVLVALGVYVASLELFDLTSLGYIVAALSVGIGFGLQEIVSNFISGLILLFERPLRVGDVVRVGQTEGIVRRINIRATTVQTRDNIYMLVPNRDFITQNVVNYVYTDPKLRTHIPFGVAYGSDVALVKEVALEAVRSHGRVLARPPPEVRFLRFGDSSLDFEALAWVQDPWEYPRIVSDLYYALFAAFQRAGIEIPFPQRDIHIKTQPPPPAPEAPPPPA